MNKLFLLSIICFLFSVNKTNAQLGFGHEIGVIAGPVMFMSDYGIRGDIETNFGNTGFGAGIIHYINFSYDAGCNCYREKTFFNDHFKLRSEISYNRTNLQHFGRWAEKDNVAGRQLAAMRGTASNLNLGMQLEFYPLSIREFEETIGRFGPFASLGFQYTRYSPQASSLLGPIGLPETTWVKYQNAFTNQAGNVWSVVGSLGTRYKLTTMSDLLLDLRWQYYFSDWVDGLRPDPRFYNENKANDWLVWLNFGYIYYID
jgi:hypothetical protein